MDARDKDSEYTSTLLSNMNGREDDLQVVDEAPEVLLASLQAKMQAGSPKKGKKKQPGQGYIPGGCKTPETQEELERALSGFDPSSPNGFVNGSYTQNKGQLMQVSSDDDGSLTVSGGDSRQTTADDSLGCSTSRQVSAGGSEDRQSSGDSVSDGKKNKISSSNRQTTAGSTGGESQHLPDEEVNWGEEDGPVAVMVRNLPLRCDSMALCKQIENLGFAGLFYDVHVPSNRDKTCTAGYGFVSFKEPSSAYAFKCAVEGQVLTGDPNLGEPRGALTVHPATMQGCVKGKAEKRPPRRGYARRPRGSGRTRTSKEPLNIPVETTPVMDNPWADAPPMARQPSGGKKKVQNMPLSAAAAVSAAKQAAQESKQTKPKQGGGVIQSNFCMFCGHKREEHSHMFCPLCGKRYIPIHA